MVEHALFYRFEWGRTHPKYICRKVQNRAIQAEYAKSETSLQIFGRLRSEIGLKRSINGPKNMSQDLP